MLWNKILLVYDGSENSLRASEYVAKMFGKTEGVQITIFGFHDKIPKHDLKGTSPVVDKLQRQITSMELDMERGQARILESKSLLSKAGVAESSINVMYNEIKQSAAKDVLAEAKKGGYGTIVVGRGDDKGTILAGGNVAKDLISKGKDIAVCVI